MEEDSGATAPQPREAKDLVTAIRTEIHRRIKMEWAEEWANGSTGRELRRILPTPSKSTLGLYKGLSRPLSSVLVQMRTSKIGLRQFLYTRGVPEIDDDQCGCGMGSQTVEHVLLRCIWFREARRRAWRDDDGRERRFADTRDILNRPAHAKSAAKFMVQTGLLGQFGAVQLNETTPASREGRR